MSRKALYKFNPLLLLVDIYKILHQIGKWLNCKTLWCFSFILSCRNLISCGPTSKNSFMSPIANYKPLISSASGIGPLDAYTNTIETKMYLSHHRAANLFFNLVAKTQLWCICIALTQQAQTEYAGLRLCDCDFSCPSKLFPRQDWNTSLSLVFFLFIWLVSASLLNNKSAWVVWQCSQTAHLLVLSPGRGL